MFIDKVKIYIKAGNGGNGIVSFHREKYVAKGGPDGGNGGTGGSIIFRVNKDLNNLVAFHYSKHFRAVDGEKGDKKRCNGKDGKDLVIEVPQGTIIRNAENNKIIADIFDVDKKYEILKGGRGGKGNAFFATSTRQAPHFSQSGEITKEYAVILELKTIADVGLIGFPNVGKSTLLSSVTNANPKIANYHFTTLTPNLGVVKYYDHSFVVADIPGLIEGASEGLGLGHDFLRHIERTRMLIHVVDISAIDGRNPYEDYLTINEELKKFSEKLGTLPQIIALNKCDLLVDKKPIEEFRSHFDKNAEIVEISALCKTNVQDLIKKTYELLVTLPERESIAIEEYNFDEKDTTSINILIDEYGVYEVSGGYIDNLIRSVVLSDYESNAFFQRRLKEDGILDKLREKGAKQGDTVRIGNIEFEFVD